MKRSTLMPAALVMLIGFGPSAPPARATFIVNLQQQGADVVASGSGTLNLTALSFVDTAIGLSALIRPNSGIVQTGQTTDNGDVYTGVTGPTSFGSGDMNFASSGSGDFVGVEGNLLVVPQGYNSGNSLSSTSTWASQTFASLGVTPGTYVWTWGSGADADSFTLQVGPASATPEPSTLTLASLLSLGLLGYGWRRRKQAPSDRAAKE